MITTWVRDRRVFRDYAVVQADTKVLARRLDGTIFRDGKELVVSGSYRDRRALARFRISQKESGFIAV